METQKESNQFKKELKKNITQYIFAAFGFVAGLAWNDAIKALIELIFPLSQDSVLVKFIYAFSVTIIVVLFTYYFVKLFKDTNAAGKT